MILQPLALQSTWVDTDSDSTWDAWQDPLTSATTPFIDLDAQSSDIDGDNATNEEERNYGSDPFVFDSDGDGLSDGDEIHLAIEGQGKGYSLTSWDSNGDGVSDHDDFYGCMSVVYSGGELPYYSNSSYSDYDGDGVKNPFDPYPFDPLNNDSDQDGIPNEIDPDSSDASNHSTINGQDWFSDALGDSDGDYTPNYWDSWPYDASNGNGGGGNSGDSDGDGLADDVDPALIDPSNYSSINDTSWHGGALGDADGDGIVNFSDSSPYQHALDDDGDGILNALDPALSDNSNFSVVNNTAWFALALADNDGDGIANFDDPNPFMSHGDEDDDGDSIINSLDPAPSDPENYSQHNMVTWYGAALADDNGNGVPNFFDPVPWPPDGDGDGLYDHEDPSPADAANISPYNATSWLSWNIFIDTDEDGVANYYDYAPLSSSDYSGYNLISWNGLAGADDDSDGHVNFYDPAPYDAGNISPFNQIAWYNNLLGDDDSDLILNFYDPSPNDPPPPVDEDDDGLNAQEEAAIGTLDTERDTDGDGLTDYEEARIYGTSPTGKHHLSQLRGWGMLYTDWQLVNHNDTDEDGIPDRVEQHYEAYGMRVNDASDAMRDIDQNGLSNLVQYRMGIALDAELDRYDSDSDGMTDVFEDYYQLNKHSFNDAVEDPDGDGVTNFEERVLVISPRDPDTLRSGWIIGDLYQLIVSVRYPQGGEPAWGGAGSGVPPDWVAALLASGPSAPDYFHFFGASSDMDEDGLPDVWEHYYGRWRYSNGLLGRMDDSQADNDGDGLTNQWEYWLGTSPVAGDSDDNGIMDGEEDNDGDGVNNQQEAVTEPDSYVIDSDADGVSDEDEAADGTDPNDAESNADVLLGLRIISKTL